MLIKQSEHTSFSLENFEGPVHFLLQLVQKSEIHISDITLHQLIRQYIGHAQQFSYNLDEGAEFVNTTASLLWLKSKTLLPIRETEEDLEEEEGSPFHILPKLLEYSRFKDMAKQLGACETNQQCFYHRGVDPEYVPSKRLQGIEQVSLEQLARVFQEVLKKYSSRKGVIHEEVWRVKDKMVFFRQAIRLESRLAFTKIFSKDCSREELIVSFLAVLEMIKLEELRICQEGSDYYLSLLSLRRIND